MDGAYRRVYYFTQQLGIAVPTAHGVGAKTRRIENLANSPYGEMIFSTRLTINRYLADSGSARR
jgi:hypothetical protein